MQNLKYLKNVVDEETRFGISLNDIALKHQEPIQFKIALSLLEFFNSGKFIDENDIKKINNIFYVSKEKYFKPNISKVFSIRVNRDDSEEEINKKISALQEKVRRFTS